MHINLLNNADTTVYLNEYVDSSTAFVRKKIKDSCIKVILMIHQEFGLQCIDILMSSDCALRNTCKSMVSHN